MTSRDAGRASVIGMLIAAIGAIVVSINYPNVSNSSNYYNSPPPTPPMPPPEVRMPPMPPPTIVPPVPTPIDVTAPPIFSNKYNSPDFFIQPAIGNLNPMLSGLTAMNPSQFPNLDSLHGNPAGMTFHTSTNADFNRLGNFGLNLRDGDALAAADPPSDGGIISLPHCDAYVGKGSTCLSHVDHTHSITCRIINLRGANQKVRVKLHKDIVGEHETDTFSLAPGFEIVCCEHKLGRDQLRPNDGFSRRRVQVMGDGKVALSEINAESVLSSSALIASMANDGDAKDKRVLKDLSRMAAVLNNVNGTQGYSK